MKVSTEDLKRLLFNVLLFSGPKTATGGSVLLSADSGTLTAYASDDFVLYTEKLPVSGTDKVEAVLTLDQVKALAKEIKDSVEEFTTVEGEPVAEDSVWPVLVSLGSRDWVSDSSGDFYVNPKRLSNLYRIRLGDKEDQPIGLRHSTFESQDVLAFIYGPRVRGIITSMSEAVLRQRECFLWDDLIEVDTEELIPEVKDIVVADRLQGAYRKHQKDEPRYRVEYTDAVDTSVAPVHVDQDAFEEFGY